MEKNTKVLKKLTTVQNSLKVSKSRTNNFAKYKYRSAEDILEAIKPLTQENGVTIIISEQNLSEGVIQSTATMLCHETGEGVAASAIVGVDFNQKGMARAQQYGAASSYGKKYALGNLLLLDDTKDADATNKHDKSTKPVLDVGF